MEQTVQSWSSVTKSIYQGVLLYQIGNVLYSIVSPINSMGNSVGNMMSFASTGSISMGPGVGDIILYLLLAAIIVGYVLFLIGLGKWAPMLAAGDAKSVKQIRTGVILGLIGAACGFIPFFGWAGGILNIIAFIMMLLGYNSLKGSTTFPAMAASGAGKLFMAMILTLVGVVVGWIPLVGGFIEMILMIIAFFMTLSGWAMIKNTPEPVA